MAEKMGGFNQQSAIRIGRATRYVESLRRNSSNPSTTVDLTEDFFLGKPDQDLEAGVLSSPDNKISIWKGPAWGVEDRDLNIDIEADYALQDFKKNEYVTMTLYKGKWYVGCLFSSPDEEPTGTGTGTGTIR